LQNFKLIPKNEFDRVRKISSRKEAHLELYADMCRLNTLVAVKKAGSGHLGSSFSAMDIITWLYLEVMNVKEVGIKDANRDIFFSSKGHDVPGQYAVLFSLGILSEEKLLKLRRLGGLDGHPERHIPGLEACTGSLGMGVSKARGMAWAKHFKNQNGRVFVMTGDGELQEGQIWESFQNTAHQEINLTVIVDHNKLQTDMPVEEIINLRNLKEKFDSFGWHVERCDGHNFLQLEKVFKKMAPISNRPKVIIADTLKGHGVSFMEKISAMASEKGKYHWHSGAPNDEDFQAGFDELYQRIQYRCQALGIIAPALKTVEITSTQSKSIVTKSYVATAFGEELVALAETHPDIVVLDGDLAADCKLRHFEKKFPDRFIECGIAEQDMVSMAGGIAGQGLLPVVNTFSSFLAARANEQIYNNVCEKTKIIYVAHFAGMIPAGPGKSHQSVRDISLFGALPNMIIIQPCNPNETRMALRYCVKKAKVNCVLRLNIGPSPREIGLPGDYSFTDGQGVSLQPGKQAVVFAYGAVMLHEALLASELAETVDFSLEVINMPWLNRFDIQWIQEVTDRHQSLYVLEDHMHVGGLGDRLLDTLVENELLGDCSFHRLGLSEFPKCGTPAEVLQYHGLDGKSIATKILEDHGKSPDRIQYELNKRIDSSESVQ
jgi:transketolase